MFREMGGKACSAKWVLFLSLSMLLAACGPQLEQPVPLDAGNAERLEEVYQEGRAAFVDGRYEDAAGHFARVANADPEHLRARINWGASLSRGGRPLLALGHFKQALGQDPDNAAALFNWGAALARLGRHKEALDKFDRARELGISELPPGLQRALGGYLRRHKQAEPENQDK